jgi:DNA-binding NtrC family response regulator
VVWLIWTALKLWCPLWAWMREGMRAMCANTGFLDFNGRATANELCAFLVYDQEEPLQAVERILLDWGMPTQRIRNCAGTKAALSEANSPALVLTDTFLPDGTWADVLRTSRSFQSGPPVIVVSRVVDIPLYLDALESGAYDFVVPRQPQVQRRING